MAAVNPIAKDTSWRSGGLIDKIIPDTSDWLKVPSCGHVPVGRISMLSTKLPLLTGFLNCKSSRKDTFSRKALAIVSAVLTIGVYGANAQSLGDGSFQLAQNTFNQQQQFPQQQNFAPQQFTLMIENRSGANIDLLRAVNGRYQVITVLQNNFATPIATFGSDVLYFGYGGQSILTSFTVQAGDNRPLQIGPELLASAGIRQPQKNGGFNQQQGGLLPDPNQNPRQNTGQIGGPAGGQNGGLLPDPNAPRNQNAQPNTQPQGGGQTVSQGTRLKDVAPPAPVDVSNVPANDPVTTAGEPSQPGSKFLRFTNLPWSSAPDEAFMLSVLRQNSALISANRFGVVSLVAKAGDATTGATWYFEETEYPDEYRIRSVENPQNAIYIAGDPVDGALLTLGPEGATAPTGLWKKRPRYPNYDSGVFLLQSAPFERLFLFYDDGLRLEEVDLSKPGARPLLMIRSVEFFKVLESVMSENAGALAELDSNIKDLNVRAEEEKKRQIAEQEREKQEALEKEAAFANRYAHLRVPTILGNGNSGVSVRMGVDKPFETEDGRHVLAYTFEKDEEVRMVSRGVLNDYNMDHRVILDVNPEVYAIVEDGKLYIRVKTPLQSPRGEKVTNSASVRLLSEGEYFVPSLDLGRDRWFIGNVNMSVQGHLAAVTSILPENENARTDIGRSADETTGVDFSTDAIGGNSSNTVGKNINESIYDYRISGLIDRKNASNIKAVYSWVGCGLAQNVTNKNSCSYNEPSDLWEEEGALIRELKQISIDLPILETDTVLKVNASKASFPQWLPVKLTYDIELHLLGIDESGTKEIQSADDAGGAFEAGVTGTLELVTSPKKWNKDDAKAIYVDRIRNSNVKRLNKYDTVRMELELLLHVEQLRPYME